MRPDLVVEGGQRDQQIARLPGRRVQGGAQPDRYEHHQLDDGREQQLLRVLRLTMGLEHASIQSAGRACSSAVRAITLTGACCSKRSRSADQTDPLPCDSFDTTER